MFVGTYAHPFDTVALSGGSTPGPVYAALGETDRAIASLEGTIAEEGRDWAPLFRCRWTYQELRHDPRIQEMVRQIGFPD